MRSLFLMILTLLLLFACKNDPVADMKPQSLLEYGVPLTVMAPQGVVINQMDLTVMKDITLKKEPNYNVQIYASKANTIDASQIKAEQLAEVKENPFFTKVVKEEPNGFIYEKQVDSLHTSYGFKYVIVQGDQEYIFQNGLMGFYDLEQVEAMYQAVQKSE